MKGSRPRRRLRGGNVRRPKHRLARWTALLAFVLFVCGLVVLFVYRTWAATFDLKQLGEMPQRSIVYDFDGKVYGRLHGENRVIVELHDVAPSFVQALLAREDTRFHSHHGLDYIGVARAIVRNILHGSMREGASTLTQQLARNSFTLGGRNLHRKLLEAMVAIRIEDEYSKQEILELYINRIYFGSGFYGLQTAAEAYFGKPASQLTLGESATLSGLIRSPNRFSPFKNPKGALMQRDTVLDRMVEEKTITKTEADQARKTPIKVVQRRGPARQDDYAMDAVRRDLEILLTQDEIDQGGLHIYTTLDPALQKITSDAVDAQLAKIEKRPGYSHPKKAQFSPQDKEQEAPTDYLQGAAVVIDNRSGGVRAIVGGRDYSESKFNRALHSRRQVGSAFKPFVYAAAFQKGLMPGAAVDDGPIHPGELPPQFASWRPSNSDGKFLGPQHADYGLIHSRNTMTVRVGSIAGLDEVRHIGTGLGLTPEMPRTPVIFLGAFETDLKSLASAYTALPNGGVRRQSYLIERIDDREGRPTYRAAHVESRVLDSGAAWLATQALEEAMKSGTGASARSQHGFKKIAAGKTGTTNDFHDAWFVGFTTTLTCGVWVGLDKPATIMSRGYGAALALPIWAQVMQNASNARYPAGPFQPTVALQRLGLCSISSKLATSRCESSGTAYEMDVPGTLAPATSCPVHGGSRGRETVADRHDPSPDNVFGRLRRFFGGQ